MSHKTKKEKKRQKKLELEEAIASGRLSLAEKRISSFEKEIEDTSVEAQPIETEIEEEPTVEEMYGEEENIIEPAPHQSVEQKPIEKIEETPVKITEKQVVKNESKPKINKEPETLENTYENYIIKFADEDIDSIAETCSQINLNAELK